MKLKVMTVIAAIVLSIAGNVYAVNVNPDGTGQVLLYPYYTVNNNNNTLVSVTNTTDKAKAVKVRFLEGKNSREVLDFNLYLSAYDVWSAAVTLIDGTPTLIVRDTSCTAPYLYNNDDGEQEFLPYALNDGGQYDISRAFEGHFEIIEMGTVVGDSAEAVTHTDGHPNDCQAIQDAWTEFGNSDDGYWIQNPTVDIEPPSGGLYGGASIINVNRGTLYSYIAVAINGWANSVEASDSDYLHQRPGTELPSLNSGNVFDAVVFLDNGEVLTSATFERSVDAVSFVLMHNTLMNDYIIEPNIGASTEWVVTFPTKNFYVDPTRNGWNDEGVDPFTSIWDNGACEVVALDGVWDTEEADLGFEGNVENRPPVVSPSLPIEGAPTAPIMFELCNETNVFQFGDTEFSETSEIFGSSNVHNFDVGSLGFFSGWVRLDLDNYAKDLNGDGTFSDQELNLSRTGLGGLEGLPVIGFSAKQYINNYTGDSGEVNASYSGTYNHKYSKEQSPE